jgi:hypothetical protein
MKKVYSQIIISLLFTLFDVFIYVIVLQIHKIIRKIVGIEALIDHLLWVIILYAPFMWIIIFIFSQIVVKSNHLKKILLSNSFIKMQLSLLLILIITNIIVGSKQINLNDFLVLAPIVPICLISVYINLRFFVYKN